MNTKSEIEGGEAKCREEELRSIERRIDIATAKLSAAEELRWGIAMPFASLLYMKYDSWILALIIGYVIFFLVTYWYEKEYDAANDTYERITGTGKYLEIKRFK